MGAVGSNSSFPSYDYEKATNFDSNFSSTNKWFNNEKLSNYGEWANGLTSDEKKAINSFTGTGYSNHFKELYDKDWSEMTDYEKQMASSLYDAINKFELKKPINVYRYADSKLFGEQGMTLKQLQELEGQIVHSNGFMSTAAADKGKPVQSSAVHMKITIPKSVGAGAWVANQSSVGTGEKEFLLNNNGFFRIGKVTLGSDHKPLIEMKWIGQSKDQIFGGSGSKGAIEEKTAKSSVKKK